MPNERMPNLTLSVSTLYFATLVIYCPLIIAVSYISTDLYAENIHTAANRTVLANQHTATTRKVTPFYFWIKIFTRKRGEKKERNTKCKKNH